MVRIDSELLVKYMKDIAKTKPITKKQEYELFTAFKNGNKKAGDLLITANLRFVLKVALSYRNSPYAFEDLISIGIIGLIQARDNFDTNKGFKFITYAVWWVRQKITSTIQDSGSIIRIPQNLHRVMNKLVNDDVPKELWPKHLLEYTEIRDNTLSLDGIKKSEDDSDDKELHHKLASNTDAPDKAIELIEIEAYVKKRLGGITKRYASILDCYYGISDGVPKTMGQVGELYGVTRERIRQLMNMGIAELQYQRPFRKRDKECIATLSRLYA